MSSQPRKWVDAFIFIYSSAFWTRKASAFCSGTRTCSVTFELSVATSSSVTPSFRSRSAPPSSGRWPRTRTWSGDQVRKVRSWPQKPRYHWLNELLFLIGTISFSELTWEISPLLCYSSQFCVSYSWLSPKSLIQETSGRLRGPRLTPLGSPNLSPTWTSYSSPCKIHFKLSSWFKIS